MPKPDGLRGAEAYWRLRDIAAESSAEEGIRQGLEDMIAGNVHAVAKVFAELRAADDTPH
jgi:hypothetical protein